MRGCVLEVDLDYSKELHEVHNIYPLAPDKLKIKRKMLSDCQLNITDDYNIYNGNDKKLVPIFFDKEKYVLHYKDLQLYISVGFKIKEV